MFSNWITDVIGTYVFLHAIYYSTHELVTVTCYCDALEIEMGSCDFFAIFS